jgi:hypothetical protein
MTMGLSNGTPLQFLYDFVDRIEPVNLGETTEIVPARVLAALHADVDDDKLSPARCQPRQFAVISALRVRS